MASIRKRVWKSSGKEQTAWIATIATSRRAPAKDLRAEESGRRWLGETQHEVARGLHTPESTSITIGEAADRWLRRGETEGLEPATLRQYHSHAVHHICPLIGNLKLARLTAPAVQDFADQLLERGRSHALARKILASLKGIVAEAQRRGLVAQNVAREVRIRTASRHGRITVPPKAEIRALLDGAEGRTRALLVVAVFAGLRSSELRGIRWQDVDFDARLIHVRQRADERGVIGSLKSEAARRSVPMSKLVIAALKQWRIAAPHGAELVFCNSRGRVDNHANIVQRVWRRSRTGSVCPGAASMPSVISMRAC